MKELEEAIKELKEHIDKVKRDYIISDYCENCGNIQSIETVLNYIDNSISKEVIEEKIKKLEKYKNITPHGIGKLEGLYELLEGK